MGAQSTCACCESGTDSGGEGMTCYCPLDGVLDTVARKYSMRVVGLLGARGPTRYSELQDALDVGSSSTLAEHLDDLVEAGLIERRSFDEVPPRVEYSLTPRGRELETRLQPLLEWAAED